jgi:tRNA G18 (ribose-2'-O)-methylase SpoU
VSIIEISSLKDPRLAPYRELKDRELAREGDRFIAEGELVVRRLLASSFPTESVLLAQRRAEEIAPLVPDHVGVFVVPDELVQRVIGFKFHSGVIACGRRKIDRTLDAIMPADPSMPLTLVILPETANAENLGSMMRIAAAFGADALLLGERSCDPFWRQAVRVSMGTCFSLPIVRSSDLLHDLRRLRDEWKVELIAAVLDESAEPLPRARRGARLGILFGNEAQGLDERYVAACDGRVTIPMRRGTDSLNVAVAAGIFLYHLTQPAR